MDMFLFQDIIVIAGLALCVIFICHRLGVPTIVGLLLTGVLAGPNGLGLVSQVKEVEHMAEIGVVCLLFTIGLEFSPASLAGVRSHVLVGGTSQILATLAAGMGLASVLGLAFNQSVFFGFLVSLSSTAIVLKILQQRSETDSPHGRLSIGILIFQDIIVVPMMLVAPMLAGQGGDVLTALIILLVKGAALILVTIVSARWLAPKALHEIARLQGREVFLLGVVLLVLGVSLLTSALGLSLALGAFLAGIIVSSSEFSHRALGDVLPFRDLFTSFFFVSVGMLLDVHYVLQNPGFVVAVTLTVLILKFIVAGAAAMLAGLSLRTAVLTGLTLCQIGEFSFILSETGLKLGLIPSDMYQLFLGVSVTTMIATPFLVYSGEWTAETISRLPWPQRLKAGFRPMAENDASPKFFNHLIIVGFGLNGRHLSQAACVAKIPHAIVELNPETVREEKKKGRQIFYGDAAQESTLEHVGIRQARVLVIVMSDPAATRRIIETARRLHPAIHIIARTRFISETEPLYELGADEVIPEDYEVSIEILNRVLLRYLVPKEDIERFVDKIRIDHYEMLRNLVYRSPTISSLEVQLSDTEIRSFRVNSDGPGEGKSLAELDLRKNYGATVLAIRRDKDFIANPASDERLRGNDVVVLMGTSESVCSVTGVINREPSSKC
jgi:monovalent cation:H+ antiporter-2, CPA2 family